MPRYQITTLIDITRTGATKSTGTAHEQHQQSNFNSLRQAIELRSNVTWSRDPIKSNGRLPDNSKATHWLWEFEVEREDLFLSDNNPVGLLIEDLHGVPIVDNLDNSVEIVPPAIQTQGTNVNIWVNELK
jgi:hypothetical protein